MKQAWIPVVVAAISMAGNVITTLIGDAKQNEVYQLRYELALERAGKEDLASKVAVAKVEAPQSRRAGRTSLASAQVGALAEAESTARATRPATRRVTMLRRGGQMLGQMLTGKAGK